jgi:RNA polymerase sigma-70 factor (ECF subfamily)
MTSDDQDAAAAARVIAGDPGAFGDIVQRWQHRLVNLAWRFCRHQATAEDMAQEAFLKAYRSLGSFRGESQFSTWLTAVALNTYRSRLHQDRQPWLGRKPVEPVDTEPSLQNALEQGQRAELVRRAVLTLPARYRDAILMYYFEDLDIAESARVLGIAEGTLKAQLHRARELLRSRCERLGLRLSDLQTEIP